MRAFSAMVFVGAVIAWPILLIGATGPRTPALGNAHVVARHSPAALNSWSAIRRQRIRLDDNADTEAIKLGQTLKDSIGPSFTPRGWQRESWKVQTVSSASNALGLRSAGVYRRRSPTGRKL
jgi:hypothetical protein